MSIQGQIIMWLLGIPALLLIILIIVFALIGPFEEDGDDDVE